MKVHKQNGKYHCWAYLGVDANGNKRVKHITADTRKDCEERAQRAIDAFKAPFYDAKQITVREAVNRYIDRKRASLSPRTLRDYITYEQTAFQRLMPVRIGDLTDDLIQHEIDNMAKTVSPKTIKNRWSFLHAAIVSVDRSYTPYIELPTSRRPKFQMPEREALFALFDGIAGTSLELPVFLACVCGLRRGEISALDVHADIDFVKGVLHVCKDMVLDEHDDWVVKPPKTEAGNRLVPVPCWLLDRLKTAADDPAFRFPVPNTISKDFWTATKDNPVGCSFHGLRHYYASVMEAAGVPEIYQMERMGHSSTYMLKRYQEYLKEKEIEINDAMIAHLDTLNPARNSL